MKNNMATADRIIRAMIAVVIAALYFTGSIPGTLGIVLIAIAVIFFITSLISFCPLYAIFGISSRKKTT
jgi:hypothetical protein